MKRMSQHTEWLSLVEVSGPFLSITVLEKVFPQGLESLNTYGKRRLRSAYDEWRDAIDGNDPQLPELHRAWCELVLHELLEFDDTVLHPAKDDFSYKSSDGIGQFSPDFVLRTDDKSVPLLLVSIFPQDTDLEKVNIQDTWPVPIYERMTLLCRAKSVRLGIITNGERWMMVNAPVGSTGSHVSWYARLWFQEPITLKAFQSLFGVRRWFGPQEETLPSMLDESLQHQEEVTDTLGEQVKRAVEVLVQCLDKADLDRNRELLHDVAPAELYEAGLTVMMRLVFILCAEERGLLLLGDPIYDQNYAISTLRGQLSEEADQHGPEVLERRYDAWARLLSVSRAVFGGISHETLRMPALGGSLFDPDRFPFLEGRSKGTYWHEIPAQPLPIDNRTVLLLLEALQVLEQCGGALLLSYKALDVEQIGHVYEGLLEHTVRRLPVDTLGFTGSQKAKNPNLSLAELESARMEGEEKLISTIEDATQKSRSSIVNALAKEVNDITFGKVLMVCGGDLNLANRIKPFTHILRTDAWGDFIVYRANSFVVTLGTDRRETGTHYTPKFLTETIVETTLEPVAYIGPAEGKSREEWKLKSSTELLALNICDPAMGSGAFLVQVCRYLSERLVEVWGKEEAEGKSITVDGLLQTSENVCEPMPDSLDERLLIARRLVAEKCLYGVDLNPLAVELAKLSIWLVTLAKGRPFGFLDHNLRSGDSLLGIHRLEQLYCFNLHADEKTPKKLFAQKIDEQINNILVLRRQLRETPIRDIRDIQHMERLDQQARQKLEHIEHIADAMIGDALATGGKQRALDTAMDNLSTWATAYIEGDNETGRKIIVEARKSLSIDLPAGKSPRKPFHWVLEFPEVFESGGFDGIVGNPPFKGGAAMGTLFGESWRNYVVCHIGNNIKTRRGQYDLCVFFVLRGAQLISRNGYLGNIVTNSFPQGDSRLMGLVPLYDNGFRVYKANNDMEWPGKAAVHVSLVWLAKVDWNGVCILDDKIVQGINSSLSSDEDITAKVLVRNRNQAFRGAMPYGEGFFINEEEAMQLLTDHNKIVLKPYLVGTDLNSHPKQKPSRYIIDFQDWKLNREKSNNSDPYVAEDFPELLKIIEERVKPQRIALKANNSTAKHRIKYWWQFSNRADNLLSAMASMNKVIAISRTTAHLAFEFVSTKFVLSERLVVIADEKFSSFSVLQSVIHEVWAFRPGTMTQGKTRTYFVAEAYESFPQPASRGSLETIGELYDEQRSITMEKRAIGLTSFYNQLHDKHCSFSDIEDMRLLQAELDQMVTHAYGWDDLDLNHGFHETKQGIRFTISEDARREVLLRLLKLNHERYEEEVAQGLHSKNNAKNNSTPCKKKVPPSGDDDDLDLFSINEE